MFGTATRVEHQTNPRFNQRIKDDIRDRLNLYRNQNRNLIDKRLHRLDREWDTERTLQTNFALLSQIGVALTAKLNRRWSILAIGIPVFTIQHTLQG